MTDRQVHFKALYAFNAEEEGELSIAQGDRLVAHPGGDGEWGTEDDIQEGWTMVTNTNTNQTGFVPVDYLERLPPPAPKQVSPKKAPTLSLHHQSSSHSQTTDEPPLSLQELAGQVSSSPNSSPTHADNALQSLSSAIPIRRISDPRLNLTLLDTLDSDSATAATQSVNFKPQFSATSMTTINNNTPSSKSPTNVTSSSKKDNDYTVRNVTPRTSATTPKSQMSARAKAAYDKVQAKNSPMNSVSSDRKLFSSIRNMDSSAQTKNFNPQLVTSIRKEEYRAMLKRNTDMFEKVCDARTSQFALATKMADSLAKTLGDRNALNGKIENDINDLMKLMESERLANLELTK